MDLRCSSKKHAVLTNGTIEVRCRSIFCGYEPGKVILHQFDAGSGELLSTKEYRDPSNERGH